MSAPIEKIPPSFWSESPIAVVHESNDTFDAETLDALNSNILIMLKIILNW